MPREIILDKGAMLRCPRCGSTQVILTRVEHIESTAISSICGRGSACSAASATSMDREGNTRLHWGYAQRVVFDADGRQWQRF
jgi:hypothetical protein